jgi:hypothetical protein
MPQSRLSEPLIRFPFSSAGSAGISKTSLASKIFSASAIFFSSIREVILSSGLLGKKQP